MKDGVVLFYCKDNTIYPVAFTEEQNELLQMTSSLFSPLKVIIDKPQGPAMNLVKARDGS